MGCTEAGCTTPGPRIRPMTPRLNQTSATTQTQSRRSKRHPSRHPSHLLRRQSQHKLFINLLYHRGKERSNHGHMDQDCRVLGHILARNGTTPTPRSKTSTTIRRYQRPHQVLVGHLLSPNTKTVTQSASQSVTLSSQETSMITSHLEAIECNTASARQNPIERNATSRRKPFYPNYQADLLGIPDALALAQTRVAAGALT